MSTKKVKNAPPQGAYEDHQDRVAKNMRDNLRKRKQQQKQRTQENKTSKTASPKQE